MNLTGNTVLITGGTSGIGLAFAQELHQLNNKVIICGRREDRLRHITEQLPGVITIVSDVSKAKDREELARWTLSNHGDINVLINNAGVQYAFDFRGEVDAQKVYSEIEVNFTAPVHLTSLLTTHFETKTESAIINISSGLAFVPIAFMPVYCATKAAVHSFTLSLRHQLKDTPIKVFEIAPPSVDTELGHDRRADKSQTHGGIPVEEFLAEAMDGLRNDTFETLVGGAKNLRGQNEKLFGAINH